MNYINKELVNGWRFNFRHQPNLFFFSDDYKWLRDIVDYFSELTDEQRWNKCYQFLLVIDKECLVSTYEDIRYLDAFHKGIITPSEKKALLQAIILSWHEMSFSSAMVGAAADFLIRHSSLSLRQTIQVFLILFKVLLDDLQSTEDAKEFVSNYFGIIDKRK